MKLTNFSKSFRNKIFVSPEKLLKIILKHGERKKKVIMCHGVFDIVHPGHIRHLLHAKSKADILIVSITADKYIKKGQYRPHVPQDLRAMNLAAFGIVDSVLIDQNDEPIKNLKILKPDFFAKGFEYISAKINEKTKEEEKTFKKDGGKILFTPGDYVNSSSSLIKFKEPDLRYEKLLIILEKYNLSFKDLRESVKHLKKQSVHIVGDTIIDTFTYCNMLGGQTKTPTLSVLFNNKIDFLGGAGVVAKHIASTGAKTYFTTLLGNDKFSKFVEKECKKFNIKLNKIEDKTRPTVNKNLFISESHRLLKVGTLDNTPISQEQLKLFSNYIKKINTNAVIFSDFRHGIFNKKNIPHLSKQINKKTFKVADSQVASWWGNIVDFKNFDLITPNEKEARFALSDQVSGVRSLAAEAYNEAKAKWLVLKMGKRGVISVINKRHFSNESYISIDSFVNNLVDPVGAGDALLAYSTLVYLNTKNKILATIIGSIAASCECEVDGNIPISPREILEKLNDIENRLNV